VWLKSRPRLTTPQERKSICGTGGCVGTRFGLGWYEKSRPHWESVPGSFNPWAVTIPTLLTRHTCFICILYVLQQIWGLSWNLSCEVYKNGLELTSRRTLKIYLQVMNIINSCIWILLWTKLYVHISKYVNMYTWVYFLEYAHACLFILCVVSLKWVWHHSQSNTNFLFFSCVTVVIMCDVSHKTSSVLSMVTSIVTMETQFWSHW
jgi:hypothetical protein